MKFFLKEGKSPIKKISRKISLHLIFSRDFCANNFMQKLMIYLRHLKDLLRVWKKKLVRNFISGAPYCNNPPICQLMYSRTDRARLSDSSPVAETCFDDRNRSSQEQTSSWTSTIHRQI